MSGPQPGLDFTAIDFETANGFRGSPCAVGLVRVRDGVMVDRAEWLMRPPRGFDRFDPRNVRIHGITAEQVSAAPRFGEVFERIAAFLGSDVLVAHNARFDVGVIESALEVSGRDVPAMGYACSLVLARRVYDLPSYALPSAAREAGFTPGRHHDALADAEACAAILIDIARRATPKAGGAAVGAEGGGVEAGGVEAGGVEALLRSQGITLGRLTARRAGVGEESRATLQARDTAGLFDAEVPLREDRALPDFLRWAEEGSNPVANRDADPGHPLYGQTVVFTGGIGLARQVAKDRAAALGAQPASRVTAQTTLLVVGDGFTAADLERSPREPVSAALGHRKTKDALRRRAQGQPVVLASEAEFLQMLDGNWPGEAG